MHLHGSFVAGAEIQRGSRRHVKSCVPSNDCQTDAGTVESKLASVCLVLKYQCSIISDF